MPHLNIKHLCKTRDAECSLLSLFDRYPDAVARYDANIRYLYANAAIARLFGISSDEMFGKSHLEIAADRDFSSRLDSLISQVFQTGEALRVTLTYPTPAGIQHFDSQILPEINSDGVVESVFIFSRNITDLKRASLQEILHTIDIIDFFPDATFVIDSEKRVVAWNKAIEQMTGILKEQIIGKKDGSSGKRVPG